MRRERLATTPHIEVDTSRVEAARREREISQGRFEAVLPLRDVMAAMRRRNHVNELLDEIVQRREENKEDR